MPQSNESQTRADRTEKSLGKDRLSYGPGHFITYSRVTGLFTAAVEVTSNSQDGCTITEVIPNSDETIELELTDAERGILRAGLLEWGGPANGTEQLAVAMGFNGANDLLVQRDRLAGALAAGAPLTRLDWARTLLATELAFISDIAGSGVDWSTTTGLSDTDSIKLLRSIQRKAAGRGLIEVWTRRGK